MRLPSPAREPAPGEGRTLAAAPVAGAPRSSLFRKLVWLTLFRLATVTLLLGAAAIYSWRLGKEGARGTAPLYAIIAATYLVSLAFAVLLRLGRALRAVAYAQIAFDVSLAAVVVALTGYSESVFLFLFSLAAVNGGILLYQRGALVAVALAVPAYLLVILGLEPRGPGGVGLFRHFVHLSAFGATAALASYLAEQLRRTGERLEAREGDLAAITALHESIVQSVESGLLTLDAAGRVTFLNRAGEQITGLAFRDLAGRPAARWFGAFQALTPREETDFVNVRGERLRLGYRVFPLQGRRGERIGSAVIFQNLTEWRALEEAVRRSERLADLGRVAAGLAHELRNPLASMSGCVELLRAHASPGDEDRRLMDIVLRETARLNELVAQFLEFARPASPRRRPADLAAVVGDTLEAFANDPAAQRVGVDRILAAAPVWCDPDQMKQVVWNLLSNAAQAIAAREPEGASGIGVIRVTCAPDAVGGAVLVVEDDGAGIAPEDVPRIFIPFFTTKERGTGLGLASVQRIVDAHGGKVDVESAPSRGTAFTIRMPPAPVAPTEPAAAEG